MSDGMKRLSARERRLVVNAIAGTAYTLMDISRRFPTNAAARTKVAMVALESIVPMLTNGDHSATTEVVNRIAEAINKDGASSGLIRPN